MLRLNSSPDAAEVGTNRLLFRDFEVANNTGVIHVRAAAEFFTPGGVDVLADKINFYDVGIFFFSSGGGSAFGGKEMQGASFCGFLFGHLFETYRPILFDFLVDQILHAFDFFESELASKGKVKTSAFGGDVGAGLLNLRSQNFTQSSLQ